MTTKCTPVEILSFVQDQRQEIYTVVDDIATKLKVLSDLAGTALAQEKLLLDTQTNQTNSAFINTFNEVMANMAGGNPLLGVRTTALEIESVPDYNAIEGECERLEHFNT